MLATVGGVGYAVTDISGALPDAARERLRQIEATIRVRELLSPEDAGQ